MTSWEAAFIKSLDDEITRIQAFREQFLESIGAKKPPTRRRKRKAPTNQLPLNMRRARKQLRLQVGTVAPKPAEVDRLVNDEVGIAGQT